MKKKQLLSIGMGVFSIVVSFVIWRYSGEDLIYADVACKFNKTDSYGYFNTWNLEQNSVLLLNKKTHIFSNVDSLPKDSNLINSKVLGDIIVAQSAQLDVSVKGDFPENIKTEIKRNLDNIFTLNVKTAQEFSVIRPFDVLTKEVKNDGRTTLTNLYHNYSESTLKCKNIIIGIVEQSIIVKDLNVSNTSKLAIDTKNEMPIGKYKVTINNNCYRALNITNAKIPTFIKISFKQIDSAGNYSDIPPTDIPDLVDYKIEPSANFPKIDVSRNSCE